jgi:hypothetical protein
MKPLQVAAIVATALAAWTAVQSLTRPAPRPAAKPKKPAPSEVANLRCTITRAVFGGTEAAVLKIKKNRRLHYVVMDLPAGPIDNPRMPDYQSGWLKATYGEVSPSAIVGVFPTVEDAVAKAASLCPSN